MTDSSLTFQSVLPSGGELWTSRSGSFLAARSPFGTGFLYVARRLPADFLARSNKIDTQLAAYSYQNERIKTFKRQIQLTLSLFTVLLLFAATWAALYLSQASNHPHPGPGRGNAVKSPPATWIHRSTSGLRTNWARWYVPSIK